MQRDTCVMCVCGKHPLPKAAQNKPLPAGKVHVYATWSCAVHRCAATGDLMDPHRCLVHQVWHLGVHCPICEQLEFLEAAKGVTS